MILLIAAAVIIAAITVWFIVRPVTRTSARGEEGQHQLVQVRERLLAQLRELDVEIADGNVDAAVGADERLRLEAELARVLKEIDAKPAKSKATAAKAPSLRPVIVMLALAVPLVAATLYFGTHRTMLAQLDQSRVMADAGVPPMVLEMVARLEKRLKENPDDPRGWIQLGRSYDVLKRREHARIAYNEAYRRASDDPEILGAYATFLFVSESTAEQLSPEAIKLFQKLIKIDPHHPSALWALGLSAYQAKQYPVVIRYWESLLKLLPPNSKSVPELRDALKTVRAEMAKSK